MDFKSFTELQKEIEESKTENKNLRLEMDQVKHVENLTRKQRDAALSILRNLCRVFELDESSDDPSLPLASAFGKAKKFLEGVGK